MDSFIHDEITIPLIRPCTIAYLNGCANYR
jgi:hypothetical protein